MITYHVSNLFSAEQKDCIITHVCNNLRGWGAGFVVPLGNKYPLAREKYFQTEKLILGTTQIVPVDIENNVYVANMIAQTLGGKRPLFYNHLIDCMEEVGRFAETVNSKIYAPLFGSKLAGGNWDFIEELMVDVWSKLDVHIYQLVGEVLRPDNHIIV